MILYFQNSKNEEREIGQSNTYKGIWDIIDTFLDEHNFKSSYCRIWVEDDSPYNKADKSKVRYMFDVGSHTEFFILEGYCEELDKLLQ